MCEKRYVLVYISEFVLRGLRLVFASFCLWAGLGGPVALASELTLFVASSLTEIADVLSADFEKRSAHDVRVVSAASSTLARQIENGAPADVFISANKQWADYVSEIGNFAPPIGLFGNRLVLVSSTDNGLHSLKQLPKLLGEGRLAIGDPAHVPAGQYAQQALEAAQIWGQVKDRLAPASDVRGVLAFVLKGAVQYGMVYASDAAGTDLNVLDIDPALYDDITYYAVVCNPDADGVQELLNYLKSPEAQTLIVRMDFVAPGGR